MANTRKKAPGTGYRFAVIAGATAILVATAWAIYAPHHPENTARKPMNPGTPSIPQSATPNPAGPDPDMAAVPQSGPSATNASLLQPSPIEPEPSTRSHSPLENSPGYYPPADPESMSVITGKRDAPLVSLELSDGASSMDDLARMLLAGVSARDETAMHTLRLTKNEFRTICWPEFPNSRPITNITLDDAWMFSMAKSKEGIDHTLDDYGGRTLELVRVASLPPIAYRNFNLYRDVTLVTRDYGSRKEVRLHFMPSVVERHGRYKALLFRD